jgi:inner membrane protein
LLVGLLWIGSIVRERQLRRDAVVQEIAESSSGAQRLEGPILVVPYEKTVKEWKGDTASGNRHVEEREVRGQMLILPEVFRVDGTVPTEPRRRGIYEARLYHANVRIQASFQIQPHYGVADFASYHFGQPSVALGITDIRGIENASKVLLNGTPLKLLAGSSSGLVGPGLHARIPTPADSDQPARLEFAIDLGIQGTSELDFVPVGRDSQISLSSDWPSPSFNGHYLPVKHTINATGFAAQWSTSFFSTNLEEAARRCGENSDCVEFNSRVLGVSFIDPVDQYLKTDRAIKYAFLFISLTFAGFFLFEVLKRLAVHPIQYSLVGAALAIFYLLLLSLAEHVGFAIAYVLSSGACVTLIGFYVSGILRSARRGIVFAGSLGGLYGMLYALLSADDYALLMGSALLFGLLAVVMVLTRKVDWSGLGRREELT